MDGAPTTAVTRSTHRASTDPDGDRRDRELAESVAGDHSDGGAAAREAFLELYDRHSRNLVAYVARVAKPSAVDDIAQDVWRRAWERLQDAPPEGPFRAWLFAVARNRITDSFRDATRRRAQPLHEEGSPTPESNDHAIDQGLLDEDVRAALADCLSKLDDRPREVVSRRWRGENYPELCHTLGIDENQAYKAYHRATRLLGECLKRANVV